MNRRTFLPIAVAWVLSWFGIEDDRYIWIDGERYMKGRQRVWNGHEWQYGSEVAILDK